MKTICLMLVSLAPVAALADPADLSGGVFIIHYESELAYTTDGPPIGDSWCEAYESYAITSCAEQVTRIDATDELPVSWYIISAWCEDKEWSGNGDPEDIQGIWRYRLARLPQKYYGHSPDHGSGQSIELTHLVRPSSVTAWHSAIWDYRTRQVEGIVIGFVVYNTHGGVERRQVDVGPAGSFRHLLRRIGRRLIRREWRSSFFWKGVRSPV